MPLWGDIVIANRFLPSIILWAGQLLVLTLGCMLLLSQFFFPTRAS